MKTSQLREDEKRAFLKIFSLFHLFALDKYFCFQYTYAKG